MKRRRWWESKICPGCERELLREDFGASTKTTDGKQQLCKKCVLAERRARAAKRYRNTFDGRVTTILGGLTVRTKAAGCLMKITRKEVAPLLRKRICAYCGQHVPPKDKVLDHVVPLARGGATRLTNLVMACWRCNHEKSDHTLEEWTDRWYQREVR